MTAREAEAGLHALADEKLAEDRRRFFKTGPGQYGEGDRFLGIKAPPLRKLAREFRPLPLDEAGELQCSGFHDLRRAFAAMNADKLTPDALQALMRHKSYSTTQRYISIARQRDAAVRGCTCRRC